MNTLRVLDGGLATERRLQDDPADDSAKGRLAEEIAEAARLCDRLADAGVRVAFEPGAAGGIAADLRAADAPGGGHPVEIGAVCNPTRLGEVTLPLL